MKSNKVPLVLIALLCAGFCAIAMGEPIVIAVAGGSASGKTHIARKLVEQLGPHRAVLYSMDNYFAPHKQPEHFYSNGSINYDHPSVVDLQQLAEDLARLKAGQTITVKEYTYGRPVEKDVFITTEPREFIILEGLYVLYPELHELTDLQVFVDVDVDTRLQRRLKRDIAEGRSTLGGMEHYFKTIAEPMHQAHIQPSSRHAHLLLESPDHLVELEEQLQRLKNFTEQFASFKKCEVRLFQ